MKTCKPGIISLLLSYFFLCSAQVHAQKNFTVNDCISYAFTHNPLLNATEKDTSIAAIGTQRVTGLYLPRVNFASAFQYYIASRKLIVEGGSLFAPPDLPEGKPLALNSGFNHNWYPTFNVNQLIFDP